MTSLTRSWRVTLPDLNRWWTLPQRSGSWVVPGVLIVTFVVSVGLLAVLVQRQAATMAAQAAVIRQQADTLGHYERTNEALLQTANHYAARLLILSEVAALDKEIIEVAGQRHAQHLATERALHEGGTRYAEAAMIEQMLQHSLDDLQIRRQMALA